MQQHLGKKKNLNVHVLHESLSKGCCLKQVGDGQIFHVHQMPLVQGVDLFDGASMRAAYCVPDVKKGAPWDFYCEEIGFNCLMAGWHIHGGCVFFFGGEI